MSGKLTLSTMHVNSLPYCCCTQSKTLPHACGSLLTSHSPMIVTLVYQEARATTSSMSTARNVRLRTSKRAADWTRPRTPDVLSFREGKGAFGFLLLDLQRPSLPGPRSVKTKTDSVVESTMELLRIRARVNVRLQRSAIAD